MSKPRVRRIVLSGVAIAVTGGLVMLAGNLLGGVYDAAGNVLAIVIWAGGFPVLDAFRRTDTSR